MNQFNVSFTPFSSLSDKFPSDSFSSGYDYFTHSSFIYQEDGTFKLNFPVDSVGINFFCQYSFNNL
jgi:hypothetical protein